MNSIEAVKAFVFRSAGLTAALRRLRVLLHHLRGRPHEDDFNALRGPAFASGRRDFHVPVHASRMLLEEGSFDAATLLSAASVARIGLPGRDHTLQVISVPLLSVDALSLRPRVVKMDLQGLELVALQGMSGTLAASRPVLMIEIGEGHAAIVAFLAARGYTRWHWDGTRLQPGVCAGTLNAFFIAAGDPALPVD